MIAAEGCCGEQRAARVTGIRWGRTSEQRLGGCLGGAQWARRLRSWGVLAAIVIGALGVTPPLGAQSAEELIPFERLRVSLRKELWRVAKRYTVRRRLRPRRVACREETLHYLLRRLPLASRLVRHLDLGRYRITKAKDDRFFIDDSAGASALCESVVREAHRIIIVARGQIDPALLPEVKGTGIIIVRTSRLADGRIEADCRVYFRVADSALHLLPRPFRRQLGGVLERRLGLFVDCAVAVAELVAKDPKRVLEAMKALGEPEPLRKEFTRRFLSEGRAKKL